MSDIFRLITIFLSRKVVIGRKSAYCLSPLLLLLSTTVGSAAPGNGDDSESVPVHTLESYIVTGSHIQAANQLIPVPLTQIDSEEMERWGNQTAIEAIRKEPFAFGATNTENDSNSGTGSASANIHGLGNLSTLTLINGRRAGGSSAVGFQHGGFADLNLTPSAAIKEVQIAEKLSCTEAAVRKERKKRKI